MPTAEIDDRIDANIDAYSPLAVLPISRRWRAFGLEMMV
jgi:hypothetical protein